MDSSASGGRARATLLFFTFPRGEERERVLLSNYTGGGGAVVLLRAEMKLDGAPRGRSIERREPSQLSLLSLSFSLVCMYERGRNRRVLGTEKKRECK